MKNLRYLASLLFAGAIFCGISIYYNNNIKKSLNSLLQRIGKKEIFLKTCGTDARDSLYESYKKRIEEDFEKNKIVVFTARWCKPCKELKKDLEAKLGNSLEEKVDFIYISNQCETYASAKLGRIYGFKPYDSFSLYYPTIIKKTHTLNVYIGYNSILQATKEYNYVCNRRKKEEKDLDYKESVVDLSKLIE